MADQDKAAVTGAGEEGRRAFYMGMKPENCPYPAIDGVIGDQRNSWLNEFKKAGGKV